MSLCMEVLCNAEDFRSIPAYSVNGFSLLAHTVGTVLTFTHPYVVIHVYLHPALYWSYSWWNWGDLWYPLQFNISFLRGFLSSWGLNNGGLISLCGDWPLHELNIWYTIWIGKRIHFSSVRNIWVLGAMGRSSSLLSTGSINSLLPYKFISTTTPPQQQHERMGEEKRKNLNANLLSLLAFRYMFQKWFVSVQILFFIPFY